MPVPTHANFAENVPLAALLIALVAQTASTGLVHGLGGALVAARLLHAFGLSRNPGPSVGRFIGAGLTWAVMGVAAVLLLV